DVRPGGRRRVRIPARVRRPGQHPAQVPRPEPGVLAVPGYAARRLIPVQDQHAVHTEPPQFHAGGQPGGPRPPAEHVRVQPCSTVLARAASRPRTPPALARGDDPPDPPLACGPCDSVAGAWAVLALEDDPPLACGPRNSVAGTLALLARVGTPPVIPET